MKVYAVVMETDADAFNVSYEIVGIYKNEDDAIEKVADIMQEIEAYVKTYPEIIDDEDVNQKAHLLWNENYPHKIKDEKIEQVWVKEFELL